MSDTPRCGICERERTTEDPDYSPFQILLRQPLGWYSGDDGEVCGQCMTDTLKETRG